MKIHRHAGYPCVECGNILDAAVCIDRGTDQAPEVGDALICKRCGTMNIIAPEGLRRPTPAEKAEVAITLSQGNN